jgi:predicted phosphoribosyltransferase
MNMHEKFFASEVMTCTPVAHARSSWRELVARVAAWVNSCADHYAAASAYEDLSRLTDAELKHRGLSRDILARDL